MSSLQVNRINDASGGVLAPISSVMRNRIINGAMTISQRNGTSSVTPATGNTYNVDRFLTYSSVTSKFSVQQNAGAVTPPVGFTNYVGITSLSAYSISAGDIFVFSQFIEGFNVADLGWGTANAKTVTLSFQVRSSLTGTFGGVIQNGSQNRTYPFTYSIPSANTWTTISVTIAGDTTGTWSTTNGIGMIVTWGLGVGSSNSGTAGAWQASGVFSATGATSVVGTNGATFYITGVQLEVGTQATSFEYRQYGQELALCQRYAQVFGGDSNYNSIGSTGIAANGTTLDYYSFPLPVKLRANPSVSYSGNWRLDDGYSGSVAVTNIAINGISLNQTAGVLSVSVASGLTGGRAYQLQSNNNTTARVILSSEL
jgi:hypothetical protein